MIFFKQLQFPDGHYLEFALLHPHFHVKVLLLIHQILILLVLGTLLSPADREGSPLHVEE